MPGHTPRGEEDNQNDRKDHSDYYSPPDVTIFIKHIDLLFVRFLKHICKAAVLSRPDNVPALKAPQLIYSLEVVKELFLH
jgi:hypothetical protein